MQNKGFQVRNGVLHADDIPLPRLAAEYDTPLYVYSARLIRDNINRLKAALGKDVLIAYATKANTNGAILSLMAKNGLGADVVSGGELRRALLAGIPADKIVFSGVGKTDAELVLAMQNGIAQINIESGAELERLVDLSPKFMTARQTLRVAFRLNPDVETDTTHAKISTGHGRSKFGMPADEIRRLYKGMIGHATIKPAGLSLHIGSQLTTLDPLRDAFHRLADLARDLPVETLDFGGGLGIVYTDEKPVDLDGYGALVREILAPLGAKLITEPGRFLVGNAGVLLTRVTHLKTTPNRPMLILDAGMNDLMRPALYDAIHTIQPVTVKKGKSQIFDVAGPVCESSDIFLRDTEMVAPERNDLMALMNAGAYGLSMAGTYNSRPLPAEILVDGENHAVIRQRQTFDDIIKDERTPDWLNA
ncbi:MAG: diaminopimelate decarboxylase [Micavibrio sp.]